MIQRTRRKLCQGAKWAVLVLFGQGCGAGPKPAVGPAEARVSAACDEARDRRAILGMVGEFEVSFAFDETLALASGYALHEPYRANAREVVEVLEDEGRAVVLQHVLLIESGEGKAEPLKHWRQSWTFEDTELLEFRGKNTFASQKLSLAEARCTWSQAVFEVDDAPRYESFGSWSHSGEISTWTSGETWRPLPRREATRRSDYDVLVGVNRHVVSASGWTHEQDNVKWVLGEGRGLAREHGQNRYQRAQLANAGVARAYLRDTGPFWSGVRAAWERALTRGPELRVATEVEGRPAFMVLFEIATAPGALKERVGQASAVIEQRVTRAAP
jgi:hypothetical protein